MLNIIQEVQSLISNIDFPIGKDDLVAIAKEKGLPAPVIAVLERFTDKEYQNEDEVREEATKQSGALGGLGNML